MNDPQRFRRAWPDICAVYRDPVLGRACLDLQEEYGADVPLLLLLCILERAGHSIARGDLERLVVESADWRETVIRPLRLARQAMKGRFTAPAETNLRDDIKRLELNAERLHVERLADAFPPSRSSGESGSLVYLGMRGVPAEAATEFLKIFNRAYGAQVLPVMSLE